MNDADISTYIIKRNGKYYCGKTTNLEQRMKYHKQKYGEIEILHIFNGDYEKQIKRAGVKLISDLMISAS